ncbi:hypothetical protein PRZ48_009693 [Zasmidium cellare]|uniref:Probable beta-glucosidase btgE n=1 Tax=Zasmidium cellare TaxID=395010 RepID=A0ABR0ED20_ZASCE|nr:hypothetical protein PRZ48_009693 [Zasmidium cellare]
MQYYAAAAVFASGLVASVSAGSVHAMHHNLHKRGTPEAYSFPETANATCGCTTWTTTWYGEATLVPGPSTVSSSSSSEVTSSTWVAPSTYVAPTTSTSEAPKPTPTSSSSSSAAPPPQYTKEVEHPKPSSSAPAPTTYAAPSSSSAPASSSSSEQGWNIPIPSWSAPSWSQPSSGAGNGWGHGGSGNGGSSSPAPNGNKWAMTYTPYTSGGECKSASDVADDIAQIKAKGFTTVRLYATDCSGVENVGSACNEHGVKMIMGIYIDSAGLNKAREQIQQLVNWGQSNGWDKVEMVVAGNEAIFNGYCSASELAGFLGEVKSAFKAAGYSGPVTTTEPLGTIQENADAICGAVDVIAANIHPFFNGAISASGAGDFVKSQLELLSQACGGAKEAYNLETGWPSKGNSNGAAIPGSSEQKEAIDAIVASAGGKSAIFSYEDDSWKAPGDLGVEQFWGCASLFTDS